MTESGSLILKIGLVILLVLANAFFVAAEFALVGSRRTRLEAMIRRGDTKAKLAKKALLHLDKYISATQLGITLASLGLGWIGEPAIAGNLERAFAGVPEPWNAVATHGVASAIAFTIITFLHIVLGELTPKALALMYPEDTSRWVAGPLIVFTIATNPFIWILNGTANFTLRLLRLRTPGEHERVHSPEEIQMLVEQSRKAGQIEKSGARMLAGVFEFSDKTAREVMTPRTQMVVLHETDSLAEAADQIAAAGRSRYPVYRESLDDITGIVHAKDVLAGLRSTKPVALASLARPVHFVPGARQVEDVLADMKLRKVHMVIVLDEFGGTAGLVTMEDLLEEIVGQIEDEYDRPGRQAGTALARGATVFPGSAELGEVSERTAEPLESDDYTTIGGYVFGRLGRLPKVGDRVEMKSGSFEVTAMEGRRVGEIRYAKKE